MSGNDNEADLRLPVLVLTDELFIYLWYRRLLECAPALEVEVTWCPEVETTEDLIRNSHFEAVIWDSHFHEGDPVAFLRFLAMAGEDRPLIAIGSEEEDQAGPEMLRLGASDYISRPRLDRWGLGRALGFAWHRYRARHLRSEALAVEVARGFINRNLFFDRLRYGILRAKRDRARLALLHLNVDGFRAINEGYGYACADQLIVQLAERAREHLRAGDSVVRIAGDELAILLEPVESSQEVMPLLQEMLERISHPFDVDGVELHITVSIGMALFPDSGSSPEMLLRQASRAMMQAKREAGNSFHLYSEQLDLHMEGQVKLEAELRHALRGEQLELHYQPRVDLETGDTLGVECLLRWNHPERGLVPPDAFIPAAERSGLIVPIGYWVIEQACERLKEAAEQGFPELIFAVNLSFRQFHDRKMTETIFRIIYNAGIDTRRLELELTESAMMHDPEYAQRCLRELNRLGISFALDDFGTGYSSLSNLHHLPISLVKIDKSFVHGIGRAPDAEHIVNAIINLSHSLDMTVVAEGVETEAQLNFLRRGHCDQVQGFYFAKPMPWNTLMEHLRQSRPARNRSS